MNNIQDINIDLTMQISNTEKVYYAIKHNQFGRNMLIIFKRHDLLPDKDGKFPFMGEWEWIEVFKKHMKEFDWDFAITEVKKNYEQN